MLKILFAIYVASSVITLIAFINTVVYYHYKIHKGEIGKCEDDEYTFIDSIYSIAIILLLSLAPLIHYSVFLTCVFRKDEITKAWEDDNYED